MSHRVSHHIDICVGVSENRICQNEAEKHDKAGKLDGSVT
jgi:hypothetical protein